jgi:hypothetical protein
MSAKTIDLRKVFDQQKAERRRQALETCIPYKAWLVAMFLGAKTEDDSPDSELPRAFVANGMHVCVFPGDDEHFIGIEIYHDVFHCVIFSCKATFFGGSFARAMSSEAEEDGFFVKPEWIESYRPGKGWESLLTTFCGQAKAKRQVVEEEQETQYLLTNFEHHWADLDKMATQAS